MKFVSQEEGKELLSDCISLIARISAFLFFLGSLSAERRTPEQGSSLRRRTDDTHVGEVYTYTSTWLYIYIQLCRVSKISKIPSDPYEAVLRNLGAYKSIFPHPQNNKEPGHHHCNKTYLLKTQQNGPSDSIRFTTGCD